MREPLKEIFELYEEKMESHPMTEKERKVWEQAQMTLGEAVIDEMLYAQDRSLLETEYDCFREGFRLGALLMLELK